MRQHLTGLFALLFALILDFSAQGQSEVRLVIAPDFGRENTLFSGERIISTAANLSTYINAHREHASKHNVYVWALNDSPDNNIIPLKNHILNQIDVDTTALLLPPTTGVALLRLDDQTQKNLRLALEAGVQIVVALTSNLNQALSTPYLNYIVTANSYTGSIYRTCNHFGDSVTVVDLGRQLKNAGVLRIATAQIETPIEVKAENKTEPQIENKTENKIENKSEVKLENKLETKASASTQTPSQPSISTQQSNTPAPILTPQLTDLTSFYPDKAFLQAIAPQKDHLNRLLQSPLCLLTAPLSTQEALWGSSAWTNLIHRFQREITGADISFFASNSFEIILDEGRITYTDIARLFPFANTLCVIELTGQEIIQHLEYSYSRHYNRLYSAQSDLLRTQSAPDGSIHLTQRPYNFDTASGIRYSVNLSKERGKQITIHSLSDGTPFDKKRRYRVTMNSFRASGGGGHLTYGAGIPESVLAQRLVSPEPHHTAPKQSLQTPQSSTNENFLQKEFAQENHTQENLAQKKLTQENLAQESRTQKPRTQMQIVQKKVAQDESPQNTLPATNQTPSQRAPHQEAPRPATDPTADHRLLLIQWLIQQKSITPDTTSNIELLPKAWVESAKAREEGISYK